MFLQINKAMFDMFDVPYENIRTRSKGTMKIDGDDFTMKFDVPGFSRKDFNITVEGSVLTIEGSTEDRKFFKSYRIQEDWDVAKAEATVKNGVLNITFPKKEEKKAKTIEVTVK